MKRDIVRPIDPLLDRLSTRDITPIISEKRADTQIEGANLTDNHISCCKPRGMYLGENFSNEKPPES